MSTDVVGLLSDIDSSLNEGWPSDNSSDTNTICLGGAKLSVVCARGGWGFRRVISGFPVSIN